MPRSVIYRFGPFELNTGSRVLLRNGASMPLPDRHLDVLALLLAHAGAIVTKDQIMAAGWHDVVVGENSIEKVMSDLRLLLGDKPAGGPHVETIRRRGYRYAGDVSCEEIGQDDVEAMLAPLRRWTDGVAALETLKIEDVCRASVIFDDVVRRAPAHAPGHVALATAGIMQYESTRADREPNRAALGAAVHHARQATRLDPRYGDAWSTLALALSRTGERVDAVEAARTATTIEPDNWRHRLRLALVASGELRFRAARRTLALMPGFPFAHFLAATVLVSRQMFDQAEQDVVAGIAGHEVQMLGGGRFSGKALHWLHGLLLARRGDEPGALASLERELSFEGDGHIYARESATHAWHAVGALRLRGGDNAGAAHAFEAALAHVPSHPLAHAGLAVAWRRAGLPTPDLTILSPAAHGSAVDVAMARAALVRESGDAPQAAGIVAHALEHEASDSSGWILPIEPLLNVAASPEAWAVPLARLRARAM